MTLCTFIPDVFVKELLHTVIQYVPPPLCVSAYSFMYYIVLMTYVSLAFLFLTCDWPSSSYPFVSIYFWDTAIPIYKHIYIFSFLVRPLMNGITSLLSASCWLLVIPITVDYNTILLLLLFQFSLCYYVTAIRNSKWQ